MIHRRSTTLKAALTAAFLTSTPAISASLESFGLDPSETVLVTAQRTETSIESSLSRADVITRKDILRSQARDIKALLETQAGIDVARTGGAGGQTSVFMRGANSNHVLVLIDGVRVASAGTGGFTWELLDLATIERIEIVRGPRAARWGSDAIGGVIQIFTRQAQGVSVQATVGSYGERSAALAFGGADQSLTASTRRLDGFSSQNEAGFAFDPDDDGFSNHQLAGQGELNLPAGQIRWSARWLEGEVEFDQGVSDVEQYAANLQYQTDLNDWAVNIDAGLYRDRLESTTPFGISENITRRSQLSVLAEKSLGNAGTWLVGADGWKESGVNVGSWRQDRNHWGLWSALDGQTGPVSYALSARLDDDERYGSETTAQAALGWQATSAIRVFGNFGEGFRSPNFSQLFSPGFGGLFAGNPNLAPETSTSYELGLDWALSDRQRFTASAFDTKIDDLINFSGTDFQAINIAKARIEGLELTHRWSSDRWSTQLNWTWQKPVDRALDQPLLRRPKNKGSAVISHQLGDRTLGAELVYLGQRVDVGQAPLSAYTLLNLTASWQLTPQWSVMTRLENITQRDYEPLVGFNAPGRSAQLSVVWRPEQ